MKNNIKKILYVAVFVIGDIGIFAAFVIFANSFNGHKTYKIEEKTKIIYELTTESATAQETKAIDAKSSSPLVNWMRRQIKNTRGK